jgi:hypothetical protein
MNERIKELAEQARKYAWENETHWSAGIERERLFDQKFAELIVKECINTIQASDESVVCGITVNQVIGDLKEHFGVE